MDINKWFEETKAHYGVRPHIVCADGFSLSVQASHFHYCSPKEDVGPYRTVEIGYPSQEIPQLMEYAEDESNPTGTVYAYVPVKIVGEIIDQHGGIQK